MAKYRGLIWQYFMTTLTKWLFKLFASLLLAGQVVVHILLKRRLHRRNILEQMSIVGTESIPIALVTAAFVGGVFTIQVAKEFIRFGAQSVIGGVLAIALTRELCPVLTAVIIAARIGSAFAAEIGTMRVTEQIDALVMLGTDPIDYLVTPRVIACVLMLPILMIFALLTGILGACLVSQALYNINPTSFFDSIQLLLKPWDLVAALVKSSIFGSLIALIGTNWGLNTTGGAKGVGESTTTAVVTALLAIFTTNFFLSWFLFGNVGGTIAKNFGFD
ncbi:MAG: MlaE family lipid ABC transporter permease subunit [Pseudanabaenaceae cyanobacterium bins.68]|nr:MlaE family lipid ABC transporter permease subunit [Pseudanabaenaceae cyanobacterium bins.68]